MSIVNTWVKAYVKKDGSIIVIPPDKMENFKPEKDMIEISGISSLSVDFGSDRYSFANIGVRCKIK
jgi:hypothetical protein